MKQLLRELEETVVDAWPAAVTEELDGWLLRASGGPSRRGNSVAPHENGKLGLEERIAHVEAWYAARNQPATFQIGPCCAPSELDAVLDLRGYEKQGTSFAATAAPDNVLQRLQGEAAQVTRQAPAAWWDVVREASRFASSADVLAGFLSRLGSRCRFATYFADGRAVAACVGVSSEQRLGVYAMLTLPSARRTGAGSALLRALAHVASEAHMDELYLLVEADNEPARALYARAGFRDLYRYHYRIQSG